MCVRDPEASGCESGPRRIGAHVGRRTVANERAYARLLVDGHYSALWLHALRQLWDSGDRLVLSLREPLGTVHETRGKHVESHLGAFRKAPLVPCADLDDDVARLH